MATMTIPEADRIYDIIAAALQDTTGRFHHPVSALEGYDIVQIDTAFKLKIANELLLLTGRDDFEERFAEGVQLYETGPLAVMNTFVPDDQVDVLWAKRAFDMMDLNFPSFSGRGFRVSQDRYSGGMVLGGVAFVGAGRRSLTTAGERRPAEMTATPDVAFVGEV